MKVAVVTGAGSGIGKASAVALAADGWTVALLGRRADLLEAVAVECPGALVLPTDVADAQAVETAFATIRRQLGRVDFLFNNAGVFAPAATIDEMPLETWHRSVDVNLNGFIYCARAAFAAMRAQDPQGGRIVNNGSISAHAPRPGSVPYTVTKHAVTGLTKCLMLDGRPFDIAAGQIDIGNALTDITARMPEGVRQADGSVRPEPVMDVAHVADAVVRMAALPLDANIPFLTIMARDMPWVGRG